MRSLLVFLAATALAAEPPIPPVPDKPQLPPFAPTPAGEVVHMLAPGFTVRELPVKLTSLNNIEYAPDGRLFAGGYDGRFHVLRDTDGDGLEDRVDTFSPEQSANYPLGIALKDGDPCFVLTDEIVRWRDTDGDGVPDKRETLRKGFDDPALASNESAPYLNHRRVDSSMALAFGPDGSTYVTMGNAGYNNPYWHDKAGAAHYAPDQRRGCLLRFTPEGKVEQLASGLRYIMSLQFNAHGDLFGTEQEGATWVPNGNPFDELLHIETGRHYGFPPRHPKWLSKVVDEPSTWNYAPQHQSACGFRFNGPAPGRGRFGPESWAGDAIVTGESRGKLWRTKLAKTAAGYVARNELIACLAMMPVDCAISPRGDLVVCCHSGKPDWGNGPRGEGRIFKISYDGKTPLPALTFAASETETTIEFDGAIAQRELAEAMFVGERNVGAIVAGRYVSAGDKFESFRPGYAVVQMQQRQPRRELTVINARLSERSVVLSSAPRTSAVNYALSLGANELAHDLSGVAVEWRAGGSSWRGWMPHPDLAAAREFTRASAFHDKLWEDVATPGTLTLRAQIDFANMLQPPTQPLSQLDYTPEPETVTLVFKSDSALTLDAPDAKRISEHEAQLTHTGAGWVPLTITLATPARTLDVSFTNPRDQHARPLGVQRFLLPFAKPAEDDRIERNIPELAGGDWPRGRDLFLGKAACATCHTLRGGGTAVGPDLNNLVHRDYASVLRDIVEPGAVINPDAIGYTVTLKDGDQVIGTRIGESEDELQIAVPGAKPRKLRKDSIAKTEPLPTSLMPPGLDKVLTPAELRDLMTYLLTEPK